MLILITSHIHEFLSEILLLQDWAVAPWWRFAVSDCGVLLVFSYFVFARRWESIENCHNLPYFAAVFHIKL